MSPRPSRPGTLAAALFHVGRAVRRQRYWLGLAALLTLAGIAAANAYVLRAGRARVLGTVDRVAPTDVALVLGCAPTTTSGRANLHFEHRLDAAAQLFHAGRVRHLLVSGANPTPVYDEPTAMRAGLMARGVPAAAITCDFAGRRTLDSVVRAREVFALDRCVIVSQRYHLDRGLVIAAHHGLEAVGFAAADVPQRMALKTEVREVLARVLVLLDLHVWDRQPRFAGPREPLLLAHATTQRASGESQPDAR